ncbi:MAG: DUF2071 domain-containing protein [Calditrichaeota bacterium]|nr:DUF2071 domain-containing protein [Calditrichota bacterium]MCB9054217.1 DUF2071 domain-containing protein [Chitinophagales bacterium]
MLAFLKNHPFGVEAFFKNSVVLTFSVPKDQIIHLIPECLELDTYNEKYAFIAVAMVQTKQLRPKGFPRILGNNFFLIGYRVFVRYRSMTGKTLRGLYILRSETDKKKMQLLGNTFTHYNYNTIDINWLESGQTIEINSKQSDFNVTVENTHNESISLPDQSPFDNWKEARRFAGPLPFTFTYNQKNKKVLIIEGVRENWKPTPLKVVKYNFPFLQKMNLSEIRLANAFIIENIPYYWKKGKTELWKEENSREP